MKNLFIIILVMVTTIQNVVAQPPNGGKLSSEQKKERENLIESIKITFLTKQLNLTKEEADKFFPVYNAYFSELKQVRKEMHDQKLDQLDMEERILNIRKKYREQFKKIFNSEIKANEVFKSEQKFRELLRKEWMRRNPDGEDHKPPPHGEKFD